MGTLDNPEGSVSKKQIAIIDTTGHSIAEFTDIYNNNYAAKGWSIKQILTLNSKVYILAEREI